MATAQPKARPTQPTARSTAVPAPGPRTPPVPAPGGPASAPTLIGSVQRALRLLEAVSDHPDGAPAKQLAREAGLPLPTAYHLLRTLTHEGYLHREQGVFVLGAAAGQLGRGEADQERREAGQDRREVVTGTMERWRDTLGAAVYFAVYREGEVELAALAESIEHPAVEEWADLRETAHAHAIGQCLLSQLDTRTRRDHLDRHPVEPLTPYTVRDASALLERLAAVERMQTVVERQEYALGTVCAAIPVTIGLTPTVLAISLPLDQEYRLRPAIERVRGELGEVVRSLMFSISI
ncbi:transcriptional regulator [Streptomyces spiroverticillatus]|uniref:Glycerol operon regulatory protein n=1 Tax=Streptomyces finlayi TaxID=67296 RepID=A0A918WUJ0_9ACTN|nr:helix-turn-helix domain-containing protein [Streptomyces finlayi]GGZ99534.1 transcriptional regulator [Streptomyces spiroverticillatus]GHC84217.1 transcriptional regulator [Streptomyces finlayi]